MQRVLAPVMKLTPPDKDFDGQVFDLRRTTQISGGGGSDHASFIAARVPGSTGASPAAATTSATPGTASGTRSTSPSPSTSSTRAR